MSIKQVKIIKIIRGILLAIYLYLMLNQDQSNNILIAFIIFICSITLGEVLPKEYKVGNTFFISKSKWLEFILELILIFALTWGLIYFL